MGDRDKGSPIVFKVAFEPLHALRVEMVRGFIQQQYLRFLQQQRGEGDAHLPPPGEGGAGSLRSAFGKAEPPENFLRPGAEGVAPLNIIPIPKMFVALEKPLACLILRGGADGFFQRLKLLLHLQNS